MGIYVTFWGVRGSIPTPGHATQRYGGNTACIEVQAGEELLYWMAALDSVVSVRYLTSTRTPIYQSAPPIQSFTLGSHSRISFFHPRLLWQ